MATLGGNIISTGGGDNHVKYADSEAIAAVEGEATLALAGDVTIDGAKSLSVDVINEKDSAAGVTIDGVLLKDNAIAANGGSAGIAISANGEVTMASQPAVAAYNSVNETDVTGDGAEVTVDFDTEVFDQNADFASDTFTAPVTGRYLILASVEVSGVTTAGGLCNIKIVASNRVWFNFQETAGEPQQAFSAQAIIDMDASDTVTITCTGLGESSDVWEISGTSHPRTYFTAALFV